MSFNYRNEMSENDPNSGFFLVHHLSVLRTPHKKSNATSGRCPHPPLPGLWWKDIAAAAFPGRATARRPPQSAGTDGAQSAWTGTTVYSVFLSYGAHAEAVHAAAWCKRSAAHCAKHSVTPRAQCTLHTDCRLAPGREKPILRRRRRPPQPLSLIHI